MLKIVHFRVKTYPVAAINWGDRLDGTLTGHVRPEPDSCTAQPITDGRNL